MVPNAFLLEWPFLAVTCSAPRLTFRGTISWCESPDSTFAAYFKQTHFFSFANGDVYILKVEWYVWYGLITIDSYTKNCCCDCSPVSQELTSSQDHVILEQTYLHSNMQVFRIHFQQRAIPLYSMPHFYSPQWQLRNMTSCSINDVTQLSRR